jgi:hypothetical protein
MMQVGDIVKYRNHRPQIPPIKGVWLVIDVEERVSLLSDRIRSGLERGKYATLKKGSNTRYTHTSHIEKV